MHSFPGRMTEQANESATKPARFCNVDGRLLLVPRQHPNPNVGFQKFLYSFGDLSKIKIFRQPNFKWEKLSPCQRWKLKIDAVRPCVLRGGLQPNYTSSWSLSSIAVAPMSVRFFSMRLATMSTFSSLREKKPVPISADIWQSEQE